MDCLRNAYQQRIAQLSPAKTTGQVNMASAESGAVSQCLKPKIDWSNYEWTLITGKGVSACEDMLAYLKSRPADMPPPVCPEGRLPPNKNWSWPEARILNDGEKQSLISGMPGDKPWVKKYYEKKFKNAKLMRVIRADITRDGISETLLAYSQNDYRQSCARATKCAVANEYFHHEIVIGYGSSDYYDLLPMNEAGTQVNWSHRTVRPTPMLMGGELVYYKRVPYWLSMPEWFQSVHGRRTHPMPVNNPASAMFSLAMVSTYSRSKPKSKLFKDVTNVSPIVLDPRNKHVCRFGYFNREVLKKYQGKGNK